jgi:hypothetical protein
MFTGIFTKILVGVLLASLLAGGGLYIKYNWFDKPAYEKEIRELQEAGIKAQAKIYKQAAEIKDLEAAKKFREVQASENQKIDQVVTAGDDAAMRDVFIGLGMLPARKDGSAAVGGESGPGR